MSFRNRTRSTEADLDITSFMNLMVILIPFLLLNAVFTQVSVLNVSLPKEGGSAAADEPKKTLVLEVMVYSDRFVVADRQAGPLKSVPYQGKEPDYKALNDYLREVKTQYPQVSEATILLEPDTSYEKLIHTMDAVRIIQSEVNGKPTKYALFPDVGIGDAPADPAKGGAA
jgi:biopolymer transport protein ExbD